MSSAQYELMPCASAASLSHIPGEMGFPIVGMLPALVKAYIPTLYRLREKYGDVVRTHTALKPGIFLFSPDQAQEILLNKDKNFSNKMGYDSVNPWFGRALMLRDFDDHKMQRRLFQTAFKSEAMGGYRAISGEVIERYMSKWKNVQSMKFVPNVQQVLVEIGLSAFYGVSSEGEKGAFLAKAFDDLINRGMMSVVKLNVPPFDYYYGIRGREAIRSFFKPMIAIKRNGKDIDLMSHLTREKDDEGKYFSDEDILANASFLFFASYDTTTTALSHLVMHLACDLQLQNKLRESCLSVDKDKLESGDLDELTELHFALNEAMRLYPSAPLMMRRSINECEMGGYRIPAHTNIFLVPPMVHRDPKVWSSPDKFDPDRFAPPREEHKRHPYGYIPFGGGAHKCIGMHFALQNAKLFMYNFLTKFKFKTEAGYTPSSQTLPVPRPAKDLPLILEKLN